MTAKVVLASGELSSTPAEPLAAQTPSAPMQLLRRESEAHLKEEPVLRPSGSSTSSYTPGFYPGETYDSHRHGAVDVVDPHADAAGFILTMHTKAQIGQDCPPKTTPIITADACDLAQKKLGGLDQVYPPIQWGSWPLGCFHDIVDDRVFFNQVSTGQLNLAAERYCTFASFSASHGDCGGTKESVGCIRHSKQNVTSADECGLLCQADEYCAGFSTLKDFGMHGYRGANECWTFVGSGCVGDNGLNEEKPASTCYTNHAKPASTSTDGWSDAS